VVKKFLDGINFLIENSLFLITGALIALVWANINPQSYQHFAHDWHFVINDIFMAFFFGIAAKEIVEALLPGGDLNPIRKAAVPLWGTLGGVLGPALIYAAGAYLLDPELIRGWAIPCATDIAFSYMFAQMIFGKNHSALPFLLLLAIADDGAGLVILALFFPSPTTTATTIGIMIACLVAAIIINLTMKKVGVKNFWPYITIGGSLSWFGLHTGGLHPALALVPIMFTMPHGVRDEGLFQELEHDEELPEKKRHHDALNEFEHFFKKPVELMLFFFGLVNAGVSISSESFQTSTLLVLAGLMIGKTLFIPLCSLLSMKVFKYELPEGMTKNDLIVVGALASIGFTVALFVATVAFPAGNILDGAKLGALLSFSGAALAFLLAKMLRVGRYAS
jgi:NhaA family Na+:H+ antiporter